jgi:hypothetical protein
LERVRGRHAIQFFTNGAVKNWFPIAFQRSSRLALGTEPIEHGDVVPVFPVAFLGNRHHGAENRQLVAHAEALHGEERFREMRRGGEHATLHDGYPAARFDEVETIEVLNFVFDAEALIEVLQVHAALQQHVLAVVDDFGFTLPGYGPRSGSPAKECPAFQ